MSLRCLTAAPQVLVQEPYGLGNAARAISAPKHWRAILAQLEDSVQLLAARPRASLQEICRRRLEEEDTVAADTDGRTADVDTPGLDLETSDLELDTADQDSADLDLADLDLEIENLELDTADLDLADLDLEDLDLDTEDRDLYSDLEW